MNDRQRLLAVFAHPDDESYRAGGLLCQRDLHQELQAFDQTAPARDMMRTTILSSTSDQPVYEIQEQLAEGSTDAVPVVDHEGNLIGLFTHADINQAYRLLSLSQKNNKLSIKRK